MSELQLLPFTVNLFSFTAELKLHLDIWQTDRVLPLLRHKLSLITY